MSNLYTAGRFQGLDSAGNPLSGGLLFSYEAGTLTPKATYTTADLDIENSNPVVLDSSGRAPVWLGSGSYRMILKTSAGVTVTDDDDIVSTTYASTNEYLPAGVGAVATTVQNKLRETISVKDFGALGNGVADDTAAIQKALTHARLSGGEVFFPAGHYKTSSPLVLDYTAATADPIEGDRSRVVLRGTGAGSVVIESSHAGDLLTYLGGSGAGGHSFFAMIGIGLLGPDRLIGSTGLRIKNASYWRVERCNVDKFQFGVYAEDCLSSAFETCRAVANTYGFTFKRGNNDASWSSVTLLLPFDGNDESTSIVDASTTGANITPRGAARLDSAAYKWGSASLNTATGGSRIEVPHSSALAFAAGNWTVEGWVRLSDVTHATKDVFLCKKSAAVGVDWLQLERRAGLNQLRLTASADGATAGLTLDSTAGLLVNDTWHHVAITRSGTEWVIWIDGLQRGTTTSSLSISAAAASPLVIGAQPDGTENWKGYIDDFRITSGVARYTIAVGDFPVPTEAFTTNSASDYQSYPNALSLNNCFISGSRRYGVWMVGGTTFQMRGGSVEGNGLDATSAADGDAIRNLCWGVKVENVGAEGRTGAVIDGVYFELNAGRSDLWLSQLPGVTAFNGVHVVSNSTFNRFSSTIYPLFNISYDSNTDGVTSRVSVIGCGFGEISPADAAGDPTYYTNGASRYYISGPVGSIQAYANYYRTPTTVLDRAVFAPIVPNFAYAGRPTPVGLDGNFYFMADAASAGGGTLPAFAASDGRRERLYALPLEGNEPLTPGLINSAASFVSTMPVYGAVLGDFVDVSFSAPLQGVALRGEVITQSRTNLATYSEQLNNAAWTKLRATVTADAIAGPMGTSTADKLIEDTSTNTHNIKTTIPFASVPINSIATWSVYAKAAERTAIRLQGVTDAGTSVALIQFHLGTGAVTTVSGTALRTAMIDAGGGWWRCEVTYNVGASATLPFDAFVYLCDVASGTPGTYTGNGTSGVYLWGGQWEIGPFASPYIQTVAASVAANHYPVQLDFWNNTGGNKTLAAGTVFARVTRPGASTN